MSFSTGINAQNYIDLIWTYSQNSKDLYGKNKKQPACPKWSCRGSSKRVLWEAQRVDRSLIRNRATFAGFNLDDSFNRISKDVQYAKALARAGRWRAHGHPGWLAPQDMRTAVTFKVEGKMAASYSRAKGTWDYQTDWLPLSTGRFYRGQGS